MEPQTFRMNCRIIEQYSKGEEEEERKIDRKKERKKERKERETDRLLTFEKVLEVFCGEVVAISETDKQEIDFRTGGHLLKHGHKFVAVDSSAFSGTFHRIEFLDSLSNRTRQIKEEI